MDENINISEVTDEIKNADENELKTVVERWYESTYTSGLKLGARYMAIGASSIMNKHLSKKEKEPTLRDYKRCIKELADFLEVQLKTQQNETQKENAE
jgi:hypothetical protein